VKFVLRPSVIFTTTIPSLEGLCRRISSLTHHSELRTPILQYVTRRFMIGDFWQIITKKPAASFSLSTQTNNMK